MIKEFDVDFLHVVISDQRDEMGMVAAHEAGKYIKDTILKNGHATAIFAAAPSQNEVLYHLSREQSVNWDRVTAFHMDEYLGLSSNASQRFGKYLDTHIFSKIPFASVNYLIEEDGKLNSKYDEMFTHGCADICFSGIGENGHIAFNDPGEADLFDPYYIKVVSLDTVCRMQQVHDGCFQSFETVPEKAITLTVPTLLRSKKIICVVPGSRKAQAVYNMLNRPIDMICPASALRLHKNATLFLDKESSSLLNQKVST